MKKDIKTLTPSEFQSNFMEFLSTFPKLIDRPVEIFNIGQTVGFIRIPTPLYRQNYNSIIIITKGNAKQQVESEILSIKEHNVLFVKQGNITALKEVVLGTEGYIILFSDGVLNTLFSKEKLINFFSIHPLIHLTDTVFNWLKPLYELLEDENSNETYNFEISQSIFQTILLKIIANSNVSNQTINKAIEITFRFKELVYKDYITQKTISYYANKLMVSENYLNRCVKQSTQIAPKEWINKVIILQSQLLLQDFTKSISEIAYELNFEDPSYFGRLFKKTTGLTPSLYRLSLMQDLSE